MKQRARISWWNVLGLWRVKHSDGFRSYHKTLPEAHDYATKCEHEFGIYEDDQ